LIDETGCVVLNEHSGRKPWLGSGTSMPQPFFAAANQQTLLLATDGLWKYADRDRLCAIARGEDLNLGVIQLIDAALPLSGPLQDDVAVVLARHISSANRAS
jgi:serine/threonine protein phosphatase PrpC